jgi:putative transposase
VATRRKSFRFRMRPTKAQESILSRLAGARRWVWNWGLRRWKDYFEANGTSISLKQLSAELTALKQQPETAWLKEADSQALQQSLKDLHRAFTNFFEKRARYPRFKSRKRDPLRFRIPQRVKIEGPYVIIPKVGKVRIFQSMDVDLPTKSASFKRDALGHWYVTLTAEFEMPDIPLPAPEKAVGIDLGLIDFATISDGSDPIPAPKFFRKGQRKLKRAQRKLSRRKPGSNRKAKARVAVAKIHQRTSNKRSDFLHKLSTQLVEDHDGICIEDLCLKGLVRTKLAKSFTDASMGEFRRQLEYKSLWARKHLIVIDRFFPSSKLCNACGVKNDHLMLNDREWDCDCKAHHQRDFLAACNIRDEGLSMLAAGHAESRNARGDTVRPAKVGSC